MLGVALAQRLRHLPAGAAGADDDHARRRCARVPRRDAGGRCCSGCAQRLRGYVGLEVGLAHAAQRAGPVVGDVVEARAGRQAAVGIALGLVVDQAAGAADELRPGQAGRIGGDGCARPMLGGGRLMPACSSALSRAISLRRCLMAGVTMATKCDSRTRRCTSASSSGSRARPGASAPTARRAAPARQAWARASSTSMKNSRSLSNGVSASFIDARASARRARPAARRAGLPGTG